MLYQIFFDNIIINCQIAEYNRGIFVYEQKE